MAHPWIVLSTTWSLEDIQAGLNVITTLVSAFAIIVFARLSWQKGVQRVHKQRSVPIPQLVSVTTLGEVQDVVGLLKSQILSRRYLRILLQCLVVAFFTTTAILAGPISRYSTRRGEITQEKCGWWAHGHHHE
jgi:Na+/glutamate symporter